MNRIGWSVDCLICGKDLRWAGTMARSERMRQIQCGICDTCQRLRHEVAREYEKASNEVAILQRLGAASPWGGDMQTADSRPPVGRWDWPLYFAMSRAVAAHDRGVELKMWPPDGGHPLYREEPA